MSEPVYWWDSTDLHDRRVSLAWYPEAEDPIAPDAVRVGSVYECERETPAMTWPPARIVAERVTLQRAAEIANERGLS
jgi:hypothetical protein